MTRAAPQPTPVRDRLVVRARNVSAATIDARRARLSCAPELALDSDGPLDLRIDCPAPPAARSRTRRCASRLALRLSRVRGRRIVSARVLHGRRTLTRAHGRRLRRVTVRRPTSRAFTLVLKVRTSGRRAATITTRRRIPACG